MIKSKNIILVDNIKKKLIFEISTEIQKQLSIPMLHALSDDMKETKINLDSEGCIVTDFFRIPTFELYKNYRNVLLNFS